MSSLIGGGQKYSCNPRFVTHSRGELLGKSNANGIGIDHPPVAQASIVVPDGRQIPFGEKVFPRSGVGQIEVVALDYAVLNPCLGKLAMELERYRTLSYAGAASDKQHFTSYVHFLSMVQMPTVPFPWNWDWSRCPPGGEERGRAQDVRARVALSTLQLAFGTRWAADHVGADAERPSLGGRQLLMRLCGLPCRALPFSRCSRAGGSAFLGRCFTGLG